MITEEAINALTKLVPDAVSMEVVKSSADPYRYWLHNRKTGDCKPYSVLCVVQRTALSIESFVDQLVELFEASATKDEDQPRDVYVDRTRIRSIVHKDTREMLFMCLVESRAMAWLSRQSELQIATRMDHRALLRLLKTVLPPHETLIDAVQSIKVKTNAEGASEIRHGRESVGSSIQRDLAGWQGPEEATFDVAVLDRPDGLPTIPIRCLVDTDLSEDEPAFSIIPLAGEIERAWRETIDQIITAIDARAEFRAFEAYHVFMGSVDIS